MRWLRSWVVMGLVVVVDLVVVALAYRLSHRAAPMEAEPGTTVSTTSGTTSGIRGPLFLAASSGGSLLRATRGSCDEREPVRSRVWVATSYRSTLGEVSVPGLQETLGLTVSDQELRIVGTSSTCRVRGYTSTDSGRTWQVGAAPTDVWYLDRDTTATAVHGPVPGKVVNLECTPTSVTTLEEGGGALLTCEGSDVLEVPRSPKQAPVTYIVSDAAAVAQPTTGTPLVLARLGSCSAAVARITSQQSARQVTCLGTTDAPLALATSGDRIFAQVGTRLLVSGRADARFSVYPGTSGSS